MVSLLFSTRRLETVDYVTEAKLTLRGRFGALEPGVNGDLLVLLSQDRWVRIRGLVDDLKAVTSASWLRETTAAESSATTFATLLV
jgi:hypothetical protein